MVDPIIQEDELFYRIYTQCKPFTMTTKEKMYALYKSVKYIVESNTEGDFVECGVWKGDSTMVMAITLMELGVTDRDIFLYDTFSGMSEPTPIDTNVYNKALSQYNLLEKKTEKWT